MQKRVVFIGLAAVAAAIVILPSLMQGVANPTAAQGQQTTIVQRTIFNHTIESSGTIAAAQRLSLAFGTSGMVSEILVEVGDEVVAGDVLARLDITDLQNQLARQEQAYLAQEANYTLLLAAPTPREIAQAEANVASARSQVEQAQSNLDASGLNQIINCANVEATERLLDRATDRYDEYVTDGYTMDASFLPDPDSEAGEALRTARSNFDVAQAQCQRTTSVAQLQAALDATQATFAQAEASLAELVSGPTDEERAQAEASLAQAALQRDNALDALADAVITAPMDGVVSSVSIRQGQRVNGMSAAIELVDIGQLHVDVAVDELDIVQVAVEQPVNVLPEALDDATLAGVVTRIAPVGDDSGGLVTYEVRVHIEDPAQHPIRVGMTADVEIMVGSSGEVLAVETDAVQREGTSEYVEVVNADGSTTRVPIRSGQSLDGLTEIMGDVVAGQTVVLPVRETLGGGSGLPFAGGN
jgi:HlyD family secretion protein